MNQPNLQKPSLINKNWRKIATFENAGVNGWRNGESYNGLVCMVDNSILIGPLTLKGLGVVQIPQIIKKCYKVQLRSIIL
jgi:hypothetical protein